MSEPSKEALELAEEYYGIGERATKLARRIDAFVAERVADQRAELGSFYEFERTARANLKALRAAADAMADAAEDGAIDRWPHLRKMVSAYRSLSPATGE